MAELIGTSRGPIRRSRLRTTATVASVGLLLAACGGGDAFDEGGGDATEAAGGGGSLVISGQNFAESSIMQNLYQGVLSEAGYDVELRPVDTRSVYIQALESGEVQVVPDYAASATEELNRAENGEDAEPLASSDIDETMAALTDLTESAGIVALEPSGAVNQNAIVVTQEFAEENDLTTISDLAALDMPLEFATAPDCSGNAFCEAGLESTYGLEFVQPLQETGFGSVDTKLAVQDGDAQVGWTGTTDGTLDTFGLVVLEDDQGLQTSENIVPLVNESVDEPAREALNELSAALTTEDLIELNRRVDQDRELPEDVAASWLEENGFGGS